MDCLHLTRSTACWTRSLRLCLGALAVLSASCKLNEKATPAGALHIAVDTDLAMPKDIDALQIEVTQSGAVIYQKRQELTDRTIQLPLEYHVDGGADGTPALIRVVAFKGDVPRVERSEIATIPTSYLGYVQLDINYLCDGTATNTGDSSCGQGETCIQGDCYSSVRDTPLANFLERTAGTTQNASTSCFDAAACLNEATEMVPDLDTCSFSAPALFPTMLNVALRLEPGSDGVCTQTACWVVLEPGQHGFRIDTNGQRVLLPEAICRRRRDGENLRVAVSMQCPTRNPGTPVCRDSVEPVTQESSEGPIAVGTGGPGAIGDACAGGATQACQMCGSQLRSCQGGLWSAYGMCMGQGACEPNAEENCGVGGMRQCGGDCTWGSCENQPCDGPATRACGNCGTQHRTCNNGVWGEWGACAGEGVCAPETTQACGADGVQACGGSCQWGECSALPCPGAASGACGNCGTHTRTCDIASATWSAWGECLGESECQPNTTMMCGRNGTRTCGGDCKWDVACTGQRCVGPATESCGLCGTRTRTCDMNTGEWSDWSSCIGEGQCAPNTARVCGNGGTQKCGGSCMWDAACTGQVCTGASSRSCGNCGIQVRSCDSNTGQWSNWSACTSQGDCAPGTTRSCGSGGTQTCSNTCEWDSACPGQECTGASSEPCGFCGTHSRTCNPNTGRWNDWGACSGAGECKPGDSMTCTGDDLQRACDNACKWGQCACTSGLSMCRTGCANLQTDEGNCGTCGTVCGSGFVCTNGVCQCPSGQRNCGGECVNPQTDKDHCGTCETKCGGNAICDRGKCVCGTSNNVSQQYCGNMCVNTQGDNANCGQCGRQCVGGHMCAAGMCTCPSGRTECPAGGGACVDLTQDPQNCGACGTQCKSGESCQAGVCTVNCPSGQVNCGNRCVSTSSDGQNCGACGVACKGMQTCQAGVCACPPDKPCRNASGDCVAIGTPGNCGACGVTCEAPQTCQGNSCACPANSPCGPSCLPLKTTDNCSKCGDRCGGDLTCVATGTTAQCQCPTGQKACANNQCYDLNGDESHCGTCDIACAPGTECRAGTCGCRDGESLCGGKCCATGMCIGNQQCGCPDGQSICGGKCCATGMCIGNQCGCPDGQSICGDKCCADGMCMANNQCGCRDDQRICDRACVPRDAAHCQGCAGCGSAPEGGEYTCNASDMCELTCDRGRTKCGSVCCGADEMCAGNNRCQPISTTGGSGGGNGNGNGNGNGSGGSGGSTGIGGSSNPSMGGRTGGGMNEGGRQGGGGPSTGGRRSEPPAAGARAA